MLGGKRDETVPVSLVYEMIEQVPTIPRDKHWVCIRITNVTAGWNKLNTTSASEATVLPSLPHVETEMKALMGFD